MFGSRNIYCLYFSDVDTKYLKIQYVDVAPMYAVFKQYRQDTIGRVAMNFFGVFFVNGKGYCKPL